LTTLLCDLYLKTSEVSFLRWGRYTNLCIFTLPFTNAVVILKQTFLCKFYMLTIQCGVVCNDNKTQSLTSGCSTDKVSMLSSFSFSIRPSRPTCSILTAVILLQNTNGKIIYINIYCRIISADRKICTTVRCTYFPVSRNNSAFLLHNTHMLPGYWEICCLWKSTGNILPKKH